MLEGRKAGVLMPIFSLPGEYGIGTFSKEAYEFVDTLKRAGQTYWQILPLGPTGYGDSPYQAFSTFAGNPYLIDLHDLISAGLLTKEECDAADLSRCDNRVDYGKMYNGKLPLLRLSYERAKEKGELLNSETFARFKEEEASWLSDFSLFMALRDRFGGGLWSTWEDEDIRLHKPEAVAWYREELKEQCRYYEYLQFVFFTQFRRWKAYAGEQGIKIIGDLPIYVAFDSADAWSGANLFQFDENNRPLGVAGCPPDAFSATGQLWGNPLYDWEKMKADGYEWWIKRFKAAFAMFDVVRVDHFRGFDEYYAIPFGAENAINGEWKKGPGMDLFNTVKERIGDVPIIAEDLGFLTDTVRQLLKDSGYPGMKVLQFAFNPSEESIYLTHEYDRNCVVYTGTHDNDTTRGWYASMPDGDRQAALCYLNNYNTPEDGIVWDYICLALRSVANTCIIPVQDYLNLGSEDRINVPSTAGGNWSFRMRPGALSDEGLIHKIWHLTKIYGRL